MNNSSSQSFLSNNNNFIGLDNSSLKNNPFFPNSQTNNSQKSISIFDEVNDNKKKKNLGFYKI